MFSGCTFLGCPVLGLTSRPPIFSLLFVYFFFFFGQFLLLLLPTNYDLLERCCLYSFLDRCIVLNHVCPLSLLTFLLSSYRPRNTPFLCLHMNKPLMWDSSAYTKQWQMLVLFVHHCCIFVSLSGHCSYLWNETSGKKKDTAENTSTYLLSCAYVWIEAIFFPYKHLMLRKRFMLQCEPGNIHLGTLADAAFL